MLDDVGDTGPVPGRRPEGEGEAVFIVLGAEVIDLAAGDTVAELEAARAEFGEFALRKEFKSRVVACHAHEHGPMCLSRQRGIVLESPYEHRDQVGRRRPHEPFFR